MELEPNTRNNTHITQTISLFGLEKGAYKIVYMSMSIEIHLREQMNEWR